MSQTKAIKTTEDCITFEMSSTYKVLKDEYLRGKRKFFSGAVANVCKGSLALPLIILADKCLDIFVFKHFFSNIEANQPKAIAEDRGNSQTKEQTQKSSQLLSRVSGLFSVQPLSTKEADDMHRILYGIRFDS
jgi:hypothetical protein